MGTCMFPPRHDVIGVPLQVAGRTLRAGQTTDPEGHGGERLATLNGFHFSEAQTASPGLRSPWASWKITWCGTLRNSVRNAAALSIGSPWPSPSARLMRVPTCSWRPSFRGTPMVERSPCKGTYRGTNLQAVGSTGSAGQHELCNAVASEHPRPSDFDLQPSCDILWHVLP